MKLNKTIALGILPLLIACNQKGDAKSKLSSSPNPPVSPLLAQAPGVGWQQIMGVAHFEDKCKIGKEANPCLRINGGEDLNDDQVFYVTQHLKELDGITENQHLQIVAETGPSITGGATEIKRVESVAFLYK